MVPPDFPCISITLSEHIIAAPVTWVFLGDDFVLFSILHLIGVSIILSIPPLDKNPRVLFSAGILLLSMSLLLKPFYLAEGPWLVWLGFPPQGFSSVDYAPLIPWYALVLLDLSAGKYFYRGYDRRHNLPDYSSHPITSLLCVIGRYSLFIYFIHQSITLFIMYLLGLGDMNLLFPDL